MKVYHGTSLSLWNKIKEEGLQPRGESKQSNWAHSIESNPDTIYLTDAYAFYFGLQAIQQVGKKFDQVVLIEMDSDNLPGQLVADEDALEQAGRTQKDGLPKSWDMKQRTRHYRGMTKQFADLALGFNWSMQVLGTAGHIGPISPEFFKRIAIIDVKKESALAWTFLDLQVSIMNYKYLAPRYRTLTQMIFGEKVDLSGPEYELVRLMGLPEIQGTIQVVDLQKETA